MENMRMSNIKKGDHVVLISTPMWGGGKKGDRAVVLDTSWDGTLKLMTTDGRSFSIDKVHVAQMPK